MRGAAKREHSERPALEEPGVPTPSATSSSALLTWLCSAGWWRLGLCESGRETAALPRVTWEVTNFSGMILRSVWWSLRGSGRGEAAGLD